MNVAVMPDVTRLQRELGDLLRRSPAQCASLSRFDTAAGECRIEVTAGTTLVAPGGLMPIACSTNFAVAAGGRVFSAPDLDVLEGYDRGWDQVTRAAGLRSTCTVPLTLGRRTVGGVSFSSREAGMVLDRTIDSVLDVSDRLIVALLGEDRQPTRSTRVLVCMDDRLAAEGLARIAERELGTEVVVCASVDEAASGVCAPTDLILTDSHVQGRRVDEHMDALHRAGVHPRVVVVSTYDTASNRSASAHAGVQGYVARDAALADIAQAIVRVSSGARLPRPAEPPVHSVTHDPLTAREGEVLVLLDRGLQVKQIARALGISDSTVKGYVRNMFTKLDAHSTTAAIYAARSTGLLQSLQGRVGVPQPA